MRPAKPHQPHTVDIESLLPILVKRFDDPSNPDAGFAEKEIRAALIEMGVVVRAREFNKLLLALRRTPIVPSDEALTLVRAQLRDRKPTKANLKIVVQELSLTLNYRQMIGIYTHITSRSTTEVTDDVIAHLRAKSVGMPLKRECVGKLAASLGYQLHKKDLARVSRLLRFEASEKPIPMSLPTQELAKMLAKKTGVPVEMVFYRALVDSALGMLDHQRFQFDPRGRDPTSVQQVRLRMQVIDPASLPREADVDN